MAKYHPIPLAFETFPVEEQLRRANLFLQHCLRRRSVREFSDRPVPRELIETVVRIAGTAPSGANTQPWKFIIVDDPDLKHRIRLGAEEEERESYGHRMPPAWLADLEELGTDWHKEFLERAPFLIVVFKEKFRVIDGEQKKNYYADESVGIACGFLLAAIHYAGLASLTHTPSPMNFLREILRRPVNEIPYLLIPVGYPAENARVPDIGKKSFGEICLFNIAPESG
jgi:iodotyrosine deiodinase